MGNKFSLATKRAIHFWPELSERNDPSRGAMIIVKLLGLISPLDVLKRQILQKRRLVALRPAN